MRHGTEKGSATLGGRRVSVTWPRARMTDGHEVPPTSHAHFAAEDLQTQMVMDRMVAEVATCRQAAPADPSAANFSTSSATSLDNPV